MEIKRSETKNPLKQDRYCRECVEGHSFKKVIDGRLQSPTNGGSFKLDPSVLELRK